MNKRWDQFLLASKSFTTWLKPPTVGSKLVELNERDLTEFLFLLASRDRRLVVDGLDLLIGGYASVLSSVEILLEQLKQRRTSEISEIGPSLTGYPLWARTAASWSTGQLRPGRYFSRITIKDLDLPENIVLRQLVENLQEAATIIEALLGTRTHPAILELLSICQRISNNLEYRSIPAAMEVSERMVLAAEGSDLASYRSIGSAFRRRAMLANLDDLAQWRRAALLAGMSEVAFVPSEEQALFELLALASTLDCIEGELAFGKPTSYWMRIGTGSASGPVVRYERPELGTIDVYFNRAPARYVSIRTRYKSVFDSHHGLASFAERRPDVTVVYRSPNRGAERVVFVEAKLPSDEQPGSYLRDSIYKCFGYLYDFDQIWPVEQHTRVVLFCPYEIGLKDRPEARALTIVNAQHRSQLAEALAEALATNSWRAAQNPIPAGGRGD